MKQVVVVVLLMLVSLTSSALGQDGSDTPDQWHSVVTPFIGQAASVPTGYSLHVSAGYTPYELRTGFFYGTLSIGIDGLLALTYSREGVLGSPIGTLKPVDQIGARLQIVPQRDQYPSVSVFVNTMTETLAEFLGDNDLKPNMPIIFQSGVMAMSYEAKSMVAGVSFASSFSEAVNFGASIGARQVDWQQKWSKYAISTSHASTSDGWTFPLEQRTTTRIDLSASVAIRLIHQLTILGELASLPFADIDPTSLVIEVGQGYVGTMGLRYSLPIPLSVELYDRWFSEGGNHTNTHQVRLGLSSNLSVF